MREFEGNYAIALRWPLKYLPSDVAARAACEVWVTVRSGAQLQRLLGHLSYDKRRAGVHGRAFVRDFPELGLFQRNAP